MPGLRPAVCCLLLISALSFVSGVGIFGHITPAQLDRLLSDRNYVIKQIGCILGGHSCDTTGNQLKIAIPEVLIRKCKGCNAHQAENAKKVIQHIETYYPAEWSQILVKYKITNNIV